MTFTDNMKTFSTSIDEAITRYNRALKAKDMDEMARAEFALKKSESDYASEVESVVFSECRDSENPILEAVKRRSFEVIGHKTLRENGDIVGIERVDDKIHDIDLLKFCKFSKLSTTWAYSVEKLGELLCLRAAKQLNISASEIKKISTTYRMSKLAKEIELGGTPASNTQVCKLLQKIIDEILFTDNGNGGNLYRCLTCDANYMTMVYTRRGKTALVVSVAKPAFVQRVVTDVLHRIVTGKVYTVDFAKMREKDEPAESKPETPAPVKPENVEVEGGFEDAEESPDFGNTPDDAPIVADTPAVE